MSASKVQSVDGPDLPTYLLRRCASNVRLGGKLVIHSPRMPFDLSRHAGHGTFSVLFASCTGRVQGSAAAGAVGALRLSLACSLRPYQCLECACKSWTHEVLVDLHRFLQHDGIGRRRFTAAGRPVLVCIGSTSGEYPCQASWSAMLSPLRWN